MKRVLLVVPTGNSVGLTSVTMGILRALGKKGFSAGFLKPISQMRASDVGPENSTSLARKAFHLDSPSPIPLNEAEHLLSIGNEQLLMEQVVDLLQQISGKADIVVVEGMVPSQLLFYSKKLNLLMAKALDADVLLVASPHEKTPEELVDAVEIEANSYREGNGSVCGCAINKIGRWSSMEDDYSNTIRHTKVRHFGNSHADASLSALVDNYRSALAPTGIPMVACIPWLDNLASPKVQDIAHHIGAHALRRGEWANRRVESVALCAMSLTKSLYYFQDGALILTSADRADIIVAAAMAATNGVRLAGILLCGRYEPDANVLILCERAFAQGLPLLTAGADIFAISHRIAQYSREISFDDLEMANNVFNSVASRVESTWLEQVLSVNREHRMSPPEFRNMLIKGARKANKRVVLPEGIEPRTIRAAVIAYQRQIAVPVLLGDPATVREVAAAQGLILPEGIEILDHLEIGKRYVDALYELRKNKGLTREKAAQLLTNTIWVGTMMLKSGDVDGLVAGALHTSADTVKPAMQIIKTAPGHSLVSSVFFMCLPNQVLVYGDCAINQDPDAEQLAQIAIQSADSARAFNIPPRVAMISYSTGNSGQGSDVEKVRQATEIVRQRRPDILVDGPLQYDAATTESVARAKAPNSPVAGRATVLIFPDLNTGNTTYKAVQRSANTVSIGPMLQGLAKPVNDLSRGALVDDIIYTIALTTIQADTLPTTIKLPSDIP